MIEIKKLSPDRWKECRDLRLEALQNDPLAFQSSYEEEIIIPEDEWRRRVDNTLFALSNDKLIGMIVYLIDHKIIERN